MLDEIPKRDYPYNTHQTKVVGRESLFSFRNFGILCALVIFGVTVFFIWTRVIDLMRVSGGLPKFEDVKNQALNFISKPGNPGVESKAEVKVISASPKDTSSAAPIYILKESDAKDSKDISKGTPLKAETQKNETQATAEPEILQNSNLQALKGQENASAPVTASLQVTEQQNQNPVLPVLPLSDSEISSSTVTANLQANDQKMDNSVIPPVTATPENTVVIAEQNKDLQAAASQAPKVESSTAIAEVAALQNSVSKTDVNAPLQTSTPSNNQALKQNLETAAVAQTVILPNTVPSPVSNNTASTPATITNAETHATPEAIAAATTGAALSSAVGSASKSSANEAGGEGASTGTTSTSNPKLEKSEAVKTNSAIKGKGDSTKSREPFPRPRKPESKNNAPSSKTVKTVSAAKPGNLAKTATLVKPANVAKTVSSAATSAPTKVVLKFQLGKTAQPSSGTKSNQALSKSSVVKPHQTPAKSPVAKPKQTLSKKTEDYERKMTDSWNKTYEAARASDPNRSLSKVESPVSKIGTTTASIHPQAQPRPKISGNHYAVQILAIEDEAKVKNFIANKHLKGKARYFRTTRNDKPWYVLVYGDFEEFDDARAAMNKLPAEIQKYRPWVRRYSSIREAMLKK